MPGPPSRTLDALTSATLKHLRDEWWDDAFTGFLVERLRPRAGNRILDVGCGTGAVELRLARLRIPQVTLFGIDLLVDRAVVAEQQTDGHNLRASFAAADACQLPFSEGTFDSTFCVAVLQHIPNASEALREFMRVTIPGGRILAVEPDNLARYWYSSSQAGLDAYAASTRLFEAQAGSRGESRQPRVGPRLPTLFAELGIELLEVQLFPVSVSRIGSPSPAVWKSRRHAIRMALTGSEDHDVQRAGAEYLDLLGAYENEASAAGRGFVEIQSTLLFAVVGQRAE